MADSKEPKKETVRITLPPRPSSSPGPSQRDTVRINLPTRPPSNGIASRPAPANPAPPGIPVPIPPAKPSFLPPTSPLAAPPSAASSSPRPPTPSGSVPFSVPKTVTQAAAMRAPEPMPDPSPSPGPKKETARISVLPDPPKTSGSVQMKKTQPLISVPEARTPVTPVHVAAPETRVTVHALPMPLCWTLVGASAVILIIEIWNYVS